MPTKKRPPYLALSARQKPLLCWLSLAGGGLASGLVMAQQADFEAHALPLKLSHALLPRRELQLFQLSTVLSLPDEGRTRRPQRDDDHDLPLRLHPALALRRESGTVAEAEGVLAMWLPFTGQPLAATPEEEDEEGRPPQGPMPAPAQQLIAPVPRRTEDDLPDLGGESWEMAPVRWNGILTSNMNRSWDDKDNSNSSVSQTTSVNASSYIYAPWFAQTTGGVNYSTARSWHRRDADSEKSEDSEAHSKAYALSGSLNLFPQSSFPLQSYYSINRSQARGEDDRSKFISSQFGLSQNFAPKGGVDSFGYNYNRSSSKEAGPNRMSNAASAFYSTRVGEEHALNASATYSDEESGREDVMKQTITLVGTHAWRFDDGININSNATINQSENDVFQEGNDRAKNRSQVVQFNSNVTWQPYDEDDEPLPMIVSGGGSFINIEQDAPDASKNRTTVLNGNGSLSYRFTNQLTGSANANLSRVDSNGMQNTFYGAGAGLNYAATPTPLGGGLLHTWNTGTSSNISRSTSDGGTDIVTASFGQSLMLPLPGLTLSANQNLSGNRTSSYGVINTLSHSLSLTKQLGTDDQQATGQISANLAHNKTAGVYGGHSNSFNLLANGKLEISRRQQLSMNANVNWMKQVQPQQNVSPSLLVINNSVVDIDEARWVGSASFMYTHVSPFDVRSLAYQANLMFSSTETSQQQSLSSLLGFGGGLVNPNFAPGLKRHWIHSMTFNHSLTYLIGRLNFQLSNAVSRVDGVDNVMIFGHVSRRFGTF